jgi:hypothetical protein
MSRDQYKKFNCYKVLGLGASESPSEIRLAWVKASFTHHPDRGGSNEAQANVNLAYEVLSDPVSRQAHDTFWKVKESGSSGKAKSTRNEPFAKFKARLEQTIRAEKAKIWNDLPLQTEKKQKQFIAELQNIKRLIAWSVIGALVCAYFAKMLPILWLGTLGAGWSVFANSLAAKIGGKKFSTFLTSESVLQEHAKQAASEKCKFDAEKLDRYTSSLASMIDLLSRPSSYDDSEELVARRLTACLFLMGYEAKFFDNTDRALLFSDKDEKILVRFRHREGEVVNVSYVKKLSALMKSKDVSRGLLFCSPGLSDNAAKFADSHGIKHYSLASMNGWINDILISEYAGPSGNILESLDMLSRFLSGISPRVARARYRRSRYRR